LYKLKYKTKYILNYTIHFKLYKLKYKTKYILNYTIQDEGEEQ